MQARDTLESGVTALGRVLVWLGIAVAFGLLIVPIVIVVWLSFNNAFVISIPPVSYSGRWYAKAFAQPEFVPAFWVSLKIAAIVTPISLIIGTTAAYAMHRRKFPGAALLEPIFYSPLMIPLIVTGIALLFFLNRIGVYSSFWSIVIGHVILTFPYVIRSVSISLSRYDVALDEAAASLGAAPWEVLWRVTLPSIRAGAIVGALFAFAMSFDDFTVTIFLVGATTQTLPVAVYQYLEWNTDPTVSAVSAMLIAVSVLVICITERIFGLDRFIGLNR
jgi:putative spermidine/putrescine transport system permease protein